MITRRDLIIGTAGALATGGLIRSIGAQEEEGKASLPVVVTTWNFAPKANKAAWKILEKGGSALDAVEKGINDIELDPAVESVGYGGTPNEHGETTLDSMIMWGPKHEVGAVGCLKRIKPAISVARKVLEKTKHTMLVGDDATRFAVKMGFEEVNLTNARSNKMWEDWVKKGKKPNHWEAEPRKDKEEEKDKEDHDTISMLAIDKNGDICAGCSTNGLDFKIPGRVGDSPITGCGAYADNDIGAAAATGNGDVMMRFLPAYQAVTNMGAGMSPRDAALDALKRIHKKGYRIGGAIIAVNKKGEYGAACLRYSSFPFGVRNDSIDKLLTVKGS